MKNFEQFTVFGHKVPPFLERLLNRWEKSKERKQRIEAYKQQLEWEEFVEETSPEKLQSFFLNIKKVNEACDRAERSRERFKKMRDE